MTKSFNSAQVFAKVVPPAFTPEAWLSNYLAVEALMEGDAVRSLSELKSIPFFCDLSDAEFFRLVDKLEAKGGLRTVRFQGETLVVVDDEFVQAQLQTLAQQLAYSASDGKAIEGNLQ